MQDSAQIKPGMIVAYRLLPKDIPLHPNKVWRGKVVKRYDTHILVEMVEPGYEGLTESVLISQVVGLS